LQQHGPARNFDDKQLDRKSDMHVALRAHYSSTFTEVCDASDHGRKHAHSTHVPTRTFQKLKADRAIWTTLAAPFMFTLTLVLAVTAPTVEAQNLATGGYHNCALTASGGVVCWGINTNGQLGDGTVIARSTPVNVSGIPFGNTAVAGGGVHTCAVTSTGGVKCWGSNATGQLGDNSTTQRLVPVDVSGLAGISNVTAGEGFSCALSTAGGVSCWGSNVDGQLGDGVSPTGANARQLTPVAVSGLGSGVTALAGSYSHACAVVGGAAKCWGINYNSQLGDLTVSQFTFENAPRGVTGLGPSTTISLATGADHSCALTTSGGVKCWGYTIYGAVGDGTSNAAVWQDAPVDVIGLASGALAITAGQYHTCALTTGGGVKCWGNNSQGQIGDGTNTQRDAPVDVIASGAVAIAAGAQHTCALFSTGVSSCWGANANGQMGNGAVGGLTYTPTATQYPAATSTTLTSNLNPSVYGDNVTFAATVTGGVNGTAVAFQDGGVNIAGCSAQPLSSGIATCTVGILLAGTHSIAAIYQGTSGTLASTSSALSQVVNKLDQTITFNALTNKIDTDPPFTVTASASSGLAVVFSSTTNSVCTVSGSTVTIVIAGTCTIAANQTGTADYNPAPQVTQSFTVLSSGPALALTAVQSRKTHGAAGPFDIPIDTSVLIGGAVTVECRAIGTGHTIVFQFNIPITATGTVTSVDSGATAIGTAVAAISGNDVVVTLTGIPDNKRVKVALANVNGIGVNVSASVGFLVGDVNGSRNVNASDISGVRARSLQTTNATNYKFDLNASGGINASDISAARARSLLVLP
jgi:alpha-tubulin suppressor-like RCC1 family protein